MTSRECGACMLCCKVMGITALQKPPGQWCAHCETGKGCAIYAGRPGECATFACAWLTDERFGPEWKPDKAKFVLVIDQARKRFTVHVDPDQPGAWKRNPYYPKLRETMLAALARGWHPFVIVAGHYSLVLPEGEHRLGKLGDADDFSVTIRLPAGGRPEITVTKADGSVRPLD